MNSIFDTDVIELACSVRTAKILDSIFFCIFPVRTERASSRKFLLLWLYFEFPDGTAHCIGDNARATIRQENLFLGGSQEFLRK